MANKNLNVSRETMERLLEYQSLVQKWTKKINLVSAADVGVIWDRHIVDSVQVYQEAPSVGDWMDIGSGGGFPGIVAAILGLEQRPSRQFALVDSDQRKCAFLRTVIRNLSLNAQVFASRVEEMAPFGAPVFSARAVSNLDTLLTHAERHMDPDGTAVFPKGARWKREHEEAQKYWSYSLRTVQSETNPDATILVIKELQRV